jgi:ribulose-5-phosphate 4-epimerase/fuculose-1-phosphate aldolase
MSQSSVLASVDKRAADAGEREVRVQLAAAYRLVDYFGWNELIYGHLTVKVPGPDDHFLINPYGLNYDEVTASNLVKVDLHGNVVDNSEHPVSRAGFVIHSAIHMARSEENKCVMHTHTRAGMALAALQDGLLPISMMSTRFHNRIAYHDYEGVSLYDDERERLLESLGDKKAMILRNHGLLTVGRSVSEAFLNLYRLERSCQIQIDAAAAGTLNTLSSDIAEKSAREIDEFSELETDKGVGWLEFAALMRKMDKIDPGYRE